MLLTLNVNNTNTVIALYPITDGKVGDLSSTWRISTRHAQTADEYGILIRNLLQGEGVQSEEITGIIIARTGSYFPAFVVAVVILLAVIPLYWLIVKM